MTATKEAKEMKAITKESLEMWVRERMRRVKVDRARGISPHLPFNRVRYQTSSYYDLFYYGRIEELENLLREVLEVSVV